MNRADILGDRDIYQGEGVGQRQLVNVVFTEGFDQGDGFSQVGDYRLDNRVAQGQGIVQSQGVGYSVAQGIA